MSNDFSKKKRKLHIKFKIYTYNNILFIGDEEVEKNYFFFHSVCRSGSIGFRMEIADNPIIGLTDLMRCELC